MSHPTHTYSIPSYFVGFLVSLSLLGVAQARSEEPSDLSQERYELAREARSAIEEYFISSNRKVKSIKLGTVSWVVNQEYLVEAEVIAQAGFTQEYIPYHCGTFIERIKEKGRTRWAVRLTTCQAYTLRPR